MSNKNSHNVAHNVIRIYTSGTTSLWWTHKSADGSVVIRLKKCKLLLLSETSKLIPHKS